MLPELLKFGVVGGVGSIVDLGGTDVLHSEYHVGPLAAKAVAVTAATAVTYLGSRFWTFKERENQPARREALLFFVLNVVGLVIAEAVIGFVTYVMGLHGKLEYNAASVAGTGLGTLFRFYAYRKWVFTAPAVRPVLAVAGSAFADYPPWGLNPAYLAPAQAAQVTAQSPARGGSAWEQPSWDREPSWHREPAWNREPAWGERTALEQPAPAYSAVSSWEQVPAGDPWGQPDPFQPRAEEPANSSGRVTSPTLTVLPAVTHDPRRPDTRPDTTGPRYDSTGPRAAGRHRRV
jgi:putative flippase GtrA